MQKHKLLPIRTFIEYAKDFNIRYSLGYSKKMKDGDIMQEIKILDAYPLTKLEGLNRCGLFYFKGFYRIFVRVSTSKEIEAFI